MSPAAFTAWINAITAADSALAGLIELGRGVRSALSAEDQATLDQRLASLQAVNDTAFARVDAKLQDAAAR